MTNRERLTPEGFQAPCRVADLTAPIGSLWESWYSHSSTAQRLQMFALVRRQGLLYAHQLPPLNTARSTVVTRLIQGEDATPACFDSLPFTPHDTDLDTCQRLAVARILASPDLSLLQGTAGTGKSRVITEVLRQTRARGWRTLVISSPNGLNQCLQRLDPQQVVCLGGSGPPALLLANQMEVLRLQAIATSQRELDAVRQRIAKLPARDDLIRHADEILLKVARLRTALADTSKQMDSLNTTLASEFASLPATLKLRNTHQTVVSEMAQRAEDIRKRLAAIEAERRARAVLLPTLQAQIDARQKGQWWSLAWWIALIGGDPVAKVQTVTHQQDQAEKDLASSREQLQSIADQQAKCPAVLDAQLDSLRQSEVESRKNALVARDAQIRSELADAEKQWSELAFGEDIQAISASGVEQLSRQHSAMEADLSSKRDACDRLLLDLQRGDFLGELILKSALVVGASLDEVPAEAGFDLVVIDEAHRLTDRELSLIATRGKRCALIADADFTLSPGIIPGPNALSHSGPLEKEAPARPTSGTRPHQEKAATRTPAPETEPGFRRLWSRFYVDPRGWPTRWQLSEGRLIARLRPPRPEQAGWLHREPVYDRPDVELRIIAPPEEDPFLSEVAFPEQTSLAEAREFIYREFQTLAVEAGGANAGWRQNGSAIVLDFMPNLSGQERAGCVNTSEVNDGFRAGSVSDEDANDQENPILTLEPGIRERLAPGGSAGWVTACLEFDSSSGWDTEKARHWAATRLGVRACGRATNLVRSYRFTEGLASTLDALLYQDVKSTCVQGLRFVPIPKDTGRAIEGGLLKSDSVVSTSHSPRPRLPRGAGLELDLSDRQHLPEPPRLPSDVLSLLPSEGIVNLSEVEAIIDYLTHILSDPNVTDRMDRKGGVGVVVLTPSSAQATLLRAMIAKTPLSANHAGRMEIATPEGFRHRESLIAIISMTRSHASRAVPFAVEPEHLAEMLTRGAEEVVIFADPGALGRRAAWFGSLEFQSEKDGLREQNLLRRLCACWPEVLPADEPLPRPTRSRETGEKADWGERGASPLQTRSEGSSV